MGHDRFVACSVEEALAYLAAHRGEALLVAGGTELLSESDGHQLSVSLVDISQVAAMKRIVRDDQSLLIGGAVTFAELAEHPVVAAEAPLVSEAARQIDLSPVRRMATIGGGIAVAQGNVGVTVALVALDAEVEITNLTGAQWLPIHSLFVRYGVSRVDSTAEIITAVRFPTTSVGQGAAIGHVAKSSVDGRSPFVAALLLALSADGEHIASAVIACGSSCCVPSRVPEVEGVLAGLALRDGQAREAFARSLGDHIVGDKPLDGLPCNQRRAMVRDVAMDVFDRALARALGA